MPPSRTDRSVWHTPLAATCTKTSWRPTGRSVSSSTAAGWFTRRSTTALIAIYDGQTTAPGQGRCVMTTSSTLQAMLTIGGEAQSGAAGTYPVHNPARPAEVVGHAPAAD